MTATVQAALITATRRLTAAGIDGAARDARLLMAHALDIPNHRITLALYDDLCPRVAQTFDALIEARAAYAPVSKLIGSRAFYGRVFTVTRDVLDPRPETEELIAQALTAPFQTFLDLGTGSGAIAVTLLAERPNAQGTATDISAKALDVAAANAGAIGVSERLDCIQSDWWDQVTGRYDLIVSNPPYIAADEMADLSAEVRDHDPHIALTDGADGLSCYRIIASHAARYLHDNGRLIVEIGPTQATAVQQLFQQAGFVNIGIRTDLDGRDRVVFGQKASIAPDTPIK